MKMFLPERAAVVCWRTFVCERKAVGRNEMELTPKARKPTPDLLAESVDDQCESAKLSIL